MPLLEINGRRVEVDDSFMSMTPEQRDATVDEIARSIGALPQGGSQQPHRSQTIPNMLAGMESPLYGPGQVAPTTNQAAMAAREPGADPSKDIQYAWQGAGRGLADLAGRPVDLAAGGMNALQASGDFVASLFGHEPAGARIRKPFLGSDWIADQVSGAYEAVGGELVQPEEVSSQARILHGVNRFGTDAVLSGGALASSAGQKGVNALRSAASAADAPAVTRAADRVLSPLAAPYARSGAPLAGDAAAGAGAGLGTGLYEEYTPEGVQDALGPFGQIMAAMGGGLAGVGAQSLASGIVKGGGNLAESVIVGNADPAAPINPATGRRYSRAEMDEAARGVQTQASNPTAAAAQIEQGVSDLMPTLHPSAMPTAGAISQDPGLALLEREARSRLPKPFAERDRVTATRAAEVLRGVAPKDAQPRDFTDAIDADFASRTRQAAADAEAARKAEAGFADVRRQTVEPLRAAAGKGTAASQRLDQIIVDQSLQPMQSRKNTAYAAIDPDRNVVRDAQPLIDAAEAIRDNLGRLNDPSSVLPVRTLERIARLAPDPAGVGADGTITFAEINALRPELSSALTKARAGGDFALADNIQALQSAIGRETERLAGEATPAGRRAAEAQRIYREEFAPVWNPGPGDEATRFRRDVNADRATRSLSPPSATAGRFLRPASPEKAASLQRIVASLPDRAAAEAEARNFLIADLAESGALDASGVSLRPDMLRRWLNNWGPSLNAAPSVRAEVEQLLSTANVQDAQAGRLANAVRQAEARLDDVTKNRGAAGLVLGKDPLNAAESIFRAKDPEKTMTELSAAVANNPRASAGLKAAVTEYIGRQTSRPDIARTTDGARPIEFERLENLFDRHERTLAKLYSADEMNALRQVHRMLRPQNALKGAASSGALHEVQKSEQAWRLLEGGLKARFGVLRGGGILRTIRIFAETLPNSQSAVRDIIVQMHFDPQLAVHLLRRNADIGSPAWNRKLNSLLATTAAARDSAAEDDGNHMHGQ